MDHFYHYTSLAKYNFIRAGGGYARQGLLPLHPVLRIGLAAKFNCPAKMEKGAVYGVTEPMPPAWMEHDYAQGLGTLEFILRCRTGLHEKMVLLKCHTLKTDRVYVLDHHYHNDPAYNGQLDTKNPVTARVKQDYWKSRIPLRDYAGEYPMGEVVCFDKIPLRRLEVMCVHDTLWSLCNELRAGVGRKPLPLQAMPRKIDYKALDAALNG